MSQRTESLVFIASKEEVGRPAMGHTGRDERAYQQRPGVDRVYLRPVEAPEEQRVPLPLSFLPLPWTFQKVQQRTPVNAGLGIWNPIDHFWRQMNLVIGGDINIPN